MSIWFQAIAVLTLVWILARLIKRRTSLLQRYFIPSSIVGGVLLLILGPQAFGAVPTDIASFLGALPALLINIVFAGLFIGKPIPKPSQVWKQAGSMIAFGNTIAWGMYVIALLLVLVLLGPVFGAPPAFGTLLEISYSGGHGTAAGLAPTFAEMGWPEATDIAMGLATISIVSAVILGIIIINIHNRRIGRVLDRASMKLQQRHMIKNGYSLTHLTRSLETNPRQHVAAIACIVLAILFGWLLLEGMIWMERSLFGGQVAIQIFPHMPLFTFVMFGGLLVQLLLSMLKLDQRVPTGVIYAYSSIALDLLIITAIGTISLGVIAHNVASFVLLAIVGIVWVLVAFFVLAPRIFRRHWFEYGMTDLGQALGTTATGLLLNRLADPLNRTGARETFAYKQLAYEPFMGGGIVTATAAVAVVEFGVVPMLTVAVCVGMFWLTVGLLLGKKRGHQQRRSERIGRMAVGE